MPNEISSRVYWLLLLHALIYWERFRSPSKTGEGNKYTKSFRSTTQTLVLLLSKDFIKLAIIASVFTVAAVYFLMDQVLTNTQHYSVQIGFVEIIVSLIMLFFCIDYHTIANDESC